MDGMSGGTERRGSITLSCGCLYDERMGDLETLDVRFRSEDCDAVEGFIRAVSHAVYCPRCRDGLGNLLIESDAEAEAWLAG